MVSGCQMEVHFLSLGIKGQLTGSMDLEDCMLVLNTSPLANLKQFGKQGVVVDRYMTIIYYQPPVAPIALSGLDMPVLLAWGKVCHILC